MSDQDISKAVADEHERHKEDAEVRAAQHNSFMSHRPFFCCLVRTLVLIVHLHGTTTPPSSAFVLRPLYNAAGAGTSHRAREERARGAAVQHEFGTQQKTRRASRQVRCRRSVCVSLCRVSCEGSSLLLFLVRVLLFLLLLHPQVSPASYDVPRGMSSPNDTAVRPPSRGIYKC